MSGNAIYQALGHWAEQTAAASLRVYAFRGGGFYEELYRSPRDSLDFLGCAKSSAQQSPDPTQARLNTKAHLDSLKFADIEALTTGAQAGNAEAQYWGLAYREGKQVRKMKSKQLDGSKSLPSKAMHLRNASSV
jgi:hypothetical protein